MNNVHFHKLDAVQFDELNKLVDQVAERQLKDFGKIKSELKPDGTLITSCDRWSDEHIVKGISTITNQKEGVLSEEGSKIVPSSNAYWVVDPLDGTTNFSAGIPFWAISIARFVNGEPETAILDIPALNKRILAIKDEGVWINNEKINPTNKQNSKSDYKLQNLPIDMGENDLNKSTSSHFDLSLKEARQNFEKEYLITQIKRFNGNIIKI